MTDKIVVMSTCASAEEAQSLAHKLVASRLAACATVVGGARSVYHWKGAVEESAEWLLIIKSRRDLFPSLRAEIARLHSYEVPEVLALAVAEGSPPYLDWIDHELRPAG